MTPEQKRRIKAEAQEARDKAAVQYGYGRRTRMAAARLKAQAEAHDPAVIGRKGGRSTSAAKARSARLNGAKGGRPKKLRGGRPRLYATNSERQRQYRLRKQTK